MKQLSDLKRYSRLAIANNRECFGHFYIKASDVEAIMPKWVSVDERLPAFGDEVVWFNYRDGFKALAEITCLVVPVDYFTHWLDNVPPAPEAGQ